MSQNNEEESTSTPTQTLPPPPPPSSPSSPSILNMSTFLTNIIDCVARPSTSDSPVRLFRSKVLDSSSPNCVSAIPADSNDSVSPFGRSACFDGVATAVFPVSTAEAIDEDDNTLSGMDSNVRQQFEAAFATFLYKNPAFTTMSHGNLTRLRSKLAKECEKNSRAEAELRRQLEMLRENKQKTELELQRELLVVTRAKAAREAELRNTIWKVRLESMAVDEEIRKVKSGNKGPPVQLPPRTQSLPETVSPIISLRSPGNMSCTSNHPEFDYAASNPLLMIPLSPEITTEESFQAELNKTRKEYERLSLEMERLREMIEGPETDKNE